MRHFLSTRIRVVLILSALIAAAIAVYGAAALLTGAVKKEDLPRRLRRFAR